MSKRKTRGEAVFYRRNLPHWQPKGAVLFITARLYGSLPKSVIDRLGYEKNAEEERLRQLGLSEEELKKQLQQKFDLNFGTFDDLLDKNTTGPHWLKEPKIAKIWMAALAHFDGDRYQVISSTVMSNHVHFVFYKLDRSMASVLHSLKSYSGLMANKLLNRIEESFDRFVRDRTEWAVRINYTLNNPVKAGLVKHWKDWPYNYVHPCFLKFVE